MAPWFLLLLLYCEVYISCSTIRKQCLDQYYHGTLTAQRYLQLIYNEGEEIFDNFPLATAHNMYFQHDCAPAHNAGVAAALLNVS